MASPEDDGEDDDYDSDGDQAPGNSGAAVVEKFIARRLHMLGARELQVREFVIVVSGCGLRLQRGLAVGRERTLFGSVGARRNGVPDFMGVDLGLAQADQVVADSVLVVEAEMLGIGANESLVEDAAGELVESFLLDGLEHARGYFGGVGNVIERDVFRFARLAKFVAELAHGSPLVGVMTRT